MCFTTQVRRPRFISDICVPTSLRTAGGETPQILGSGDLRNWGAVGNRNTIHWWHSTWLWVHLRCRIFIHKAILNRNSSYIMVVKKSIYYIESFRIYLHKWGMDSDLICFSLWGHSVWSRVQRLWKTSPLAGCISATRSRVAGLGKFHIPKPGKSVSLYWAHFFLENHTLKIFKNISSYISHL